MPLSRHITQGRLLYFTRNPDAISVSENDHYRWLAFDHVVQSVMSKHNNSRLTLPHHYALLLPLTFMTPHQVVEFGLGGGNIARFLSCYFNSINHEVIEQNQNVIDCFNQYFSYHNNGMKIINQDAYEWLKINHQRNKQHIKSHTCWFIYDIYQHQDEQVSSTNHALHQLINTLNEHQLLSINLPFIEQIELTDLLATIQSALPLHRIIMYRVPHYRNIVMHLIPKSLHRHTTLQSGLPQRLVKYWLKYHEQFEITNQTLAG